VHDIVAIDRDGHWALTNYIVLPHIELNRSTGHVGDRFTVYAHGFSPTVPVTLVWDGVSTQFYSITDNRGFACIEAVVPPVSSGTYQVYAYDRWGETSQTLNFTVIPLYPPVLIHPEGYINTTAATLGWTSVEGAAGYLVAYDTDPNFPNPQNVTTNNITTVISGLTNGMKYYWHVSSLDIAGNQGEFSLPLNFTVDTDAPNSTISGEPYVRDPRFTIVYNATDTVSGVEAVSLYYAYNGTNYTMYATSNLASGAFAFDALYGEGVYSFYIVVADRAGNRGSSSVLNVLLDMSAPWSYVLPLPAVVNTTSFNITIVSEDTLSGMKDVRLYYSVDGGLTWEYYNTYIVGGYNATTTVLFNATHEGTYQFVAIGEDLAGNIDPAGVAEAFTTVDWIPPSASV